MEKKLKRPNLIIIVDDYLVRDAIVARFGAAYFNRFLNYNEKATPYDHDLCERMRMRLSGRIILMELVSLSDVHRFYAKGFPDNSVIILDDDLGSDGSSEPIFYLFSEENKKFTLVHCSPGVKFIKKAEEAGFKNFIYDDGSKKYRTEIGETILKMCMGG